VKDGKGKRRVDHQRHPQQGQLRANKWREALAGAGALQHPQIGGEKDKDRESAIDHHQRHDELASDITVEGARRHSVLDAKVTGNRRRSTRWPESAALSHTISTRRGMRNCAPSSVAESPKAMPASGTT
jgi:hypothetical protein